MTMKKGIAKLVRLNSWVSQEQKKCIEGLSKEKGISEAELVRLAIYKVYKVK